MKVGVFSSHFSNSGGIYIQHDQHITVES